MLSVKIISGLLLVLIIGACRIPEKEKSVLIRVSNDRIDGYNGVCGYATPEGDTLIPIGKYQHCFTDTFKTLAIVLTTDDQLIGIDRQEHKLFNVFWCDNGPDEPSEGLFRIVSDSLIGYADYSGKIVISPQFSCAFPFHNGKAKVAFDCRSVADGEYTRWESTSWRYIDSAGTFVE